MRQRLKDASAIVVALLPALVGAAPAADPAGVVFTCVTASGKRITSDRLIAECADREQRVLNRDGSLRRVVPPSYTADERAENEAREKQRAAERAAFEEAARRDRNLMKRYPNEESHRTARSRALDDVRVAIASSQKRLEILTAERKPLADEEEFYVGKPLPVKLRRQIDANEAATEALRTLVANQQSELERINAHFDMELARLRKLWGGAAPGSMGPMRDLSEPAAAKSAAAAR